MSATRVWAHLRRHRNDAALVTGVTAVVLGNALLGAAPAGGLAPVDYPLLLAGPAVLALRDRAPRLVLLATLIWVAARFLRGDPGPIVALPALVAVFSGVLAGHGRFASATAASFLLASVGLGLTLGGQPTGEALQNGLLVVGWFVAAGVMGEAYRGWSAYTREVEQRAAEAERTREEEALRRAGEERLRIARDLHDSLTHAISVIKVQAGVAVHLARKRGEEVPEALLAIQEASGEANRELRSTLEVLRESDPEGHLAAGDRASLEHLDALVARTRLTGLSVSATINGHRPKIPTAVDRTAYRIIQEALTNVTRHAGAGASATIRLDYGRDGFSVRVEDDGRAAAEEPHVPGTGLLGMRERVVALGGEVTAGPRPEGGFRVHAELPLQPAEQGSVSAEASS